MRKLSFRALAAFGATLLLTTVVGCELITGGSTASPTPTPAPSTKAYTLTQAPGKDNWPNLKFAVTPVAGKSISKLTFTYAVDANMLLSATGFGFNLQFNDLWTENMTVPTKASTWTTTTDVATLLWKNGTTDAAFAPVADKAVNMNAWYTGTTASSLYIKQVNITYTDNSTEVITFTGPTATPVHIVATSGTTDVAFSSRFWVSDWTTGTGAVDLSAGLTQGVTTVAF